MPCTVRVAVMAPIRQPPTANVQRASRVRSSSRTYRSQVNNSVVATASVTALRWSPASCQNAPVTQRRRVVGPLEPPRMSECDSRTFTRGNDGGVERTTSTGAVLRALAQRGPEQLPDDRAGPFSPGSLARRGPVPVDTNSGAHRAVRARTRVRSADGTGTKTRRGKRASSVPASWRTCL